MEVPIAYDEFKNISILLDRNHNFLVFQVLDFQDDVHKKNASFQECHVLVYHPRQKIMSFSTNSAKMK